MNTVVLQLKTCSHQQHHEEKPAHWTRHVQKTHGDPAH